MTQAYLEGFKKTAEAYGVEPETLLKVAQGTAFPSYKGYDPADHGARDGSNIVSQVNRFLEDAKKGLQQGAEYYGGVAKQLGKDVFTGTATNLENSSKNLNKNWGDLVGRALAHIRNGAVGYNNLVAHNMPTTTNAVQQAYRSIAGKQKLDPNGPLGKILESFKRPATPAK